jgi:hypothetical protein
MVRQSPKGIPSAGGHEGASDEESSTFIFKYDLEAKVVLSFEEKIRLEGLNPAPTRAVRGNLVEVGAFENQTFGVVP